MNILRCVMRNNFFKLFFGFLLVGGLYAQEGASEKPVWFSGNDRLVDLLTPGLGSFGSPILFNESPVADSINPALSGFRQRATIDFSYSGIFSDSQISIDGGDPHGGAFGHLVSVGASIPSKVGVFTLSGIYANGSSQEFPLGNQGGINFSYARDVYDDLFFGFGINTALGQSPVAGENPLWSVGLDIGAIHAPGKVGRVNDFVWGITLQNIGWGTLPFAVGIMAPVSSSLFTFETGLSFTAVEKDDFKLGYSADLALPGFVNLRLKTGFSFLFKDEFQFNIATTVDVRELAGTFPYSKPRYGSLLPSFGFTYRYRDRSDKNQMHVDDTEHSDIAFNELHFRASATPITENMWATGVGFTIPLGVYDHYPPVIELFPDSEDFFIEVEVEVEEEVEVEVEDPSPLSFVDDIKTFSMNDLKLFAMMTDSLFVEEDEIQETENFESEESNSEDDILTIDEPLFLTQEEIPQNPNIRFYISPNLDGIKDNLVVPFNVTDKRYIKGFNFLIFDNAGKNVRKISNKEQRKENQDRNFFRRLFRSEKGIDLPDQIIWDGMTDTGEVASDGIYHFRLEVWDDNDNLARSPIISLVLDNTFPQIELKESANELDNIFSPNDDGNKDLILIRQSGSIEELWQASIYSDILGPIRNLDIVNNQPKDFYWDGVTSQGFLAPDGVYHYQVSAEDRAGNKSSATIKNIIISTEQTPIKINIDKSHFSPNSDGVQDTILLSSDIPVKKGILSWEMAILDDEDNLFWNKTGENSLPSEISFDGISNNSVVLLEGAYKAKLSVLYNNGNNPTSVSPEFIVDLTLPMAVVMADETIFSPDNDGKMDLITFRHDTSTEKVWQGSIKNEVGEVVQQFEWLKNPEEKFIWDGYLDDGTILKDGAYVYEITAIDDAGNSFTSNPVNFEISTIATPITLTVADVAFSPNNDGTKDSILLKPDIAVKMGIDRFNLSISDANGDTVREISKKLPIQPEYFWDGFLNDGIKASDGHYTASLFVFYKQGNEEHAVSRSFILDTVKPEFEGTIENEIFSPEGDGFKDFALLVNEGSFEDRWVANFLDEKQNIVHSYTFTGKPENIQWNGSDSNGNPLPDGRYKYQIKSEDLAGNSTEFTIFPIVIDTRPTQLFMTTNKNLISPNGDDYLDSVEFSTIFSLKEGIEKWSMDFIDSANPENIVKTFSGEKIPPESIVWDGRNNDGEVVEGSFIPRLRASYTKGNQLEVVTEPLLVDITSPVVDVAISPQPFSPDNDGIDDELTINLEIEDLSGVEKWLFNIYDPKNRNFKQFKGVGTPVSQLHWDGRSYKGDLVVSTEDYPYKLQLVDKAGNIKEVSGVIPVDVLVIQDGDRLKVQISNINFMPNSAKLVFDDEEIIAQNTYVLERLAQILGKYASYNIHIEGHANALQWANPTKAKIEEDDLLTPLSESRAETVKNILIELGIDPKRLTSKGLGGQFPVVDPKVDYQSWADDSWKNRRVEFILVK